MMETKGAQTCHKPFSSNDFDALDRVADAEESRPYFKKLREIFEQLKRKLDIPLTEISMCMSHDFEVAIEEGATIVRVGIVVFGEK